MIEANADYPDPHNFNLNATHDQEVFLHQFEEAQAHDPQVKYAVFIFYAIMVRTSCLVVILVVSWRDCNALKAMMKAIDVADDHGAGAKRLVLVEEEAQAVI